MKTGLFSEYRGLRKELYILFIGSVMTNMGAMIWPMFTLILSEKLGLSAGTIATYMLIYSIAALPMQLIGGKLADRFNKRNIIIICDLVSICAFIYCSLVEINFTAIIIFSCACLFQSVERPSYESLVADFTTGKDRERAYSLSYLGSNLGLVLAPTIGGILFNNHLNLCFLINGCAIALSTILIFLFIKDVHKETDETGSDVYEKPLDDGISSFTYIFRNRVILIFLVALMLWESVYGMYDYLMPINLAAIHGDFGPTLFGTMTSVNCIVVVLFTALVTRVFRKMRDTDKMITGEILMLAGYAIFMMFARLSLMCYICMFVFTIGEIFTTITSMPFLTRRIPSSHRGRITSISIVFCSLGASLIKILVGRIYDAKGSDRAWTVTMIFGFIQMILLIVIRIMDRKDYRLLYSNENESGNG